MALLTAKKLDWSIVSRFGDRKDIGYMSIIINVNNGEIYIVPKDIEHIDLVCEILNTNKSYIQSNPQVASSFVPSIIEIKDNMVYGVITGVSGSEIGYNIKHTKNQLDVAHTSALRFAIECDIPKHPQFKSKIIYKYLIK